MKKLILIAFCFSVWQYSNGQPPGDAKKGSYQKTKLTYELINAPNNTFCYDIYSDGKKIIHQPSIPALQGNNGFKTKKDAEKIAILVISKLKNGESLPTVSMEELKAQKIIN